jgi:spoIIIJ-associated protein
MDKLEIIKETVSQLIKLMNFEGDVLIDSSDDDNIIVEIQTKEAGSLIGQAGASLEALQYLARVLVSKKIEEPVHFTLDVNNYKRHRAELLKELAMNIAKQALSQKVAVTLQPMSSYERRLIHLTLAENPQINTESIGQGEERRVVVKPVK